MNDYSNDPIFQELGRELLDVRRELAESLHVSRHVVLDMAEANKLIGEHAQALKSMFERYGVDLEESLAVTKLVVEIAGNLLLVSTSLKIGACGCRTRVDRAAIDEPLPPPLETPTQAQIEERALEPLPANVRRLPLRRFALLVKPRGPGGAA